MHPPTTHSVSSAPSPAEIFQLDDLSPEVRLIRRNRQIVAWSASKIEKAVRSAFIELRLDFAPAARIAESVTARVRAEGNSCVGIEDVQDMVQEELMKQGHYPVAVHYILYRAERTRLRAEAVDGESAPLPSAITILGPTADELDAELYNPVELHRRIAFARTGLDLCLSPKEIERELLRSVGSEITREDLKATIILNAKTLIERDADFAKFSARILLTFIYEEVLDWDILRDGFGKLKKAHRSGFATYIARGIEIKRIDPALAARYDLETLAKKLDPSADLDFDYLGVQTLYDRYLIVDKTGAAHRRLETPQFFWMRVAMGLFKEESNRTTDPQDTSGKVPSKAEGYAVSLYNLYKSRRFCSSTPTLFNSGTPHSQLSSCYISTIDDSIESIMQRGIADSAYMAKYAGGLGGSWTQVRGTGAHIAGTNGESQGVIPFFKMYNDMLNAVNQGGKRRGSGCNYLETWHNDIEDFLELRKNVGDDRRRCHEMNTAHWIPDLFMKRVEAREDWSLFRSNEVPDLHELYGQAFERRYAEYEALAAEGKIWTRVMPAIDLWKSMLKAIFETGHPWLTWKDACNVRSPQDHAGVIHSSNLCTEICLNTSDLEIAVCNLGSVLIDEHLLPDGAIDHPKLQETVTLAVRALDNVVDINFYPVEATRTSNLRHRPVGLGMMGLQNALHKKGLAFASQEAVEFNDEIAEAIAYYAYLASSQLAKEKGAYSTYKGSKWDRGILPQDTIDLLEAERGIQIDTPRDGKMDWDPVRNHIAAHGMRNSNVMAIAPTATISNVMGTTPCIEPNYKNLFVKSNMSGDFTVLSLPLVRELKSLGLWDKEMLDQLKYYDGELDEIPGIPEDVKRRHATVFGIPYQFVIDAAARRGKWIDQAQSLNLWLPEANLKTLSHMYRRAWDKGLKTTYYLRSLGASSIEKSTIDAGKALRGLVAEAAPAMQCRIDDPTCESCQ
jgi:ribonucleoside-diphosphate reductase alpha chain